MTSTLKPTHESMNKFTDDKTNQNAQRNSMSRCNINDSPGLAVAMGKGNDLMQDNSNDKDKNYILGSDIAKDEKAMKNISNYLLNQSLKRKRKENDVQFKGGKFGQKKFLKQQRLEKIAKLRKQQIKKMKLLNRFGKNNASNVASSNNDNENKNEMDDNSNNENGNDNDNNDNNNNDSGNLNENKQNSNCNENKENGDVHMLVDPVVSQFLQDLDVSNDNDNDNENSMANINNKNVINGDINVNNNGQLMQSGDKKNQDSYFCINCHIYVNDRAAHNAIYHSK